MNEKIYIEHESKEEWNEIKIKRKEKRIDIRATEKDKKILIEKAKEKGETITQYIWNTLYDKWEMPREDGLIIDKEE